MQARRSLLRAIFAAAAFFATAAQADTVQYVYDELGRLAATIESTGQVRYYTYDAAGNLLSISSASASQVAILTLSPGHGVVGSSVTIVGSGFIADPAQNTVRFAGTLASVTSASANSIVATVPAGAATGPVSVTNANGTATSAQVFALVFAPTVTGVAPGLVPRGSVFRVDIAGSNLAFATAVTFTQPGLAATIAAGASGGRLPINLAVAPTVPAGSYGFSVSNAAGTAASGSVTVSVGIAISGDIPIVQTPLSVFLPPPALSPPPSGTSVSVSPPTSVRMP